MHEERFSRNPVTRTAVAAMWWNAVVLLPFDNYFSSFATLPILYTKYLRFIPDSNRDKHDSEEVLVIRDAPVTFPIVTSLCRVFSPRGSVGRTLPLGRSVSFILAPAPSCSESRLKQKNYVSNIMDSFDSQLSTTTVASRSLSGVLTAPPIQQAPGSITAL